VNLSVKKEVCVFRILIALILISSCLRQTAYAQELSLLRQPPAGFGANLPTGILASGPAANSSGAFALEALGGIAGSLTGMGVVAVASNCDVEDLACTLLTVGAGGALSAVGATVGTTLVARQTGSHRSIPGALVGSVVGTGVGLGVHYLLNRESDRNLGDKVVVPIFAVAQGIFAAWGSRMAGR
jgi:hypothetical protein